MSLIARLAPGLSGGSEQLAAAFHEGHNDMSAALDTRLQTLGDQLSQRMLSFQIEGKETDSASEGGGSVAGKVGITLAWVPEEHGGPGLFVLLHGNGEVTAPLSSNWRLKVKFASTGAVDFLIWDGVEVNGPADASASFTIETTRKTDELGPYLLGFAKGTRLELSKATITGQLGATGASVKAVSKKSSLVMEVAEADPFVERSIPAKEVRFDIDLGLGFSSEKGLFLEGGSGLQLTLPVNRSIGPVRLRQLHLALGGGPSGTEVRLDFLATLEVKDEGKACRIDWSSQFEPKGISEEQARGMIDQMRNDVGLAAQRPARSRATDVCGDGEQAEQHEQKQRRALHVLVLEIHGADEEAERDDDAYGREMIQHHVQVRPRPMHNRSYPVGATAALRTLPHCDSACNHRPSRGHGLLRGAKPAQIAAARDLS